MAKVLLSLRDASVPLISEVAKSLKLIIQPKLWQNCPIRPFGGDLLVSAGPQGCCTSLWLGNERLQRCQHPHPWPPRMTPFKL